MRKTVLAAVFVSLAAWGLAGDASAFGHKVRTNCIGYYPGLYSFAPYGYPPYVYNCTYRFPKYCGHRKACWRGYLTCTTPNPYCAYGCGGGCYGGGGGYGCGSACMMGCGCGGGCGSCDGCGGGCGSCDGCGGGCSGCGGGEYSNSPAASAPGSQETDERVLYDGPAADAPAPAPAPEAADPSANNSQTSFRMASQTRRDGSPAFTRGLRSYRDGNMNEALRSFDTAAAAEPQNALYHYYRALTVYNLQGAEAAGQWLDQAVALERQAPVEHWGRIMERVQGRARLWVEEARRDAGISR
jgi:hypothetical protein